MLKKMQGLFKKSGQILNLKARAEFPLSTQRIISERAGLQCSLPTCNAITSGADSTSSGTSRSGVASHIYSASVGGPRGRGGLTEEELKHPSNGIWLCATHARIVDNNNGRDFPAETLLSYKTLHEARIARESQGLFSPVGWIHDLEIVESPIFKNGQKVTFSKLNLLYGDNVTGKSTIADFVTGAFDAENLWRWRQPGTAFIHYRLSYFSPDQISIDVEIRGETPLKQKINRMTVPFNPLGVRIFVFSDRRAKRGKDHLEDLANALDLEPYAVRNLVEEIKSFPFSKISSLRFEEDEEGKTQLICDMQGGTPEMPLNALGGREIETVFMEFFTAAARFSGRYMPTVLVIDGGLTMLSSKVFDYYSHHLLDAANPFQTIMCVPTQAIDLDALTWGGWEVIRTEGSVPNIRLSQQLRLGEVSKSGSQAES